MIKNVEASFTSFARHHTSIKIIMSVGVYTFNYYGQLFFLLLRFPFPNSFTRFTYLQCVRLDLTMMVL